MALLLCWGLQQTWNDPGCQRLAAGAALLFHLQYQQAASSDYH